MIGQVLCFFGLHKWLSCIPLTQERGCARCPAKKPAKLRMSQKEKEVIRRLEEGTDGHERRER